MSKDPLNLPRCSFCDKVDLPLVAGAGARICQDCAQTAIRHFSQPPPYRQSGAVSEVSKALSGFLGLPTLFGPARKLIHHLASPLNLPLGLLGQRNGMANHVLIVGPTGSGKTRLALALRKVAPTAIIDVAQMTPAGHDGISLTATVRALLRETDGDREKARYGIVILDNLDSWLFHHPNPHRQNLWWELLMYLEGCNITLTGKAVLETDNMIFVGLLRSQTTPKNGKQIQTLLEQGLPEQVVARMPLKLFLESPGPTDILALLEKSNSPIFREYKVTQSARQYLANRAFNLGLGAWGLGHVLSELDLLIGLEARDPKRIDAKFLERRLE